MTRNAAVQETVKVSAKYETAGCWQIKEGFAAEVEGESMVSEGCYSSRPRGTMSELFERGGVRVEARATKRGVERRTWYKSSFTTRLRF